jgi:hypothetical protein
MRLQLGLDGRPGSTPAGNRPAASRGTRKAQPSGRRAGRGGRLWRWRWPRCGRMVAPPRLRRERPGRGRGWAGEVVEPGPAGDYRHGESRAAQVFAGLLLGGQQRRRRRLAKAWMSHAGLPRRRRRLRAATSAVGADGPARATGRTGRRARPPVGGGRLLRPPSGLLERPVGRGMPVAVQVVAGHRASPRTDPLRTGPRADPRRRSSTIANRLAVPDLPRLSLLALR